MSFSKLFDCEVASRPHHSDFSTDDTSNRFFCGREFRLIVFVLMLFLFAISGCKRNAMEPEQPDGIPEIIAAQIQANPHNVVSAIAKIRVRNAATVAVEYGTDGLFEMATPAMPLNGEAMELPVLGLKAESKYTMWVVASSASGRQSRSQACAFETAALPGDLPVLGILTNQSSGAGFVMMGFTVSDNSAKSYALIIDDGGSVVWYREFPRPVVDFQKQAHGSFTAFSTLDGSLSHFYELDQLGNVLREFHASAGRTTGAHELRLFDDRYCLFGLESRTQDLSAIGGASNAAVRGMVIEYHRANRAPLFWSTFDHLEVTEAARDIPVLGEDVSPWHCNAIEIDTDDHLLLSFRNTDQIVKVNSQTGDIIWRLGGKKSSFTFVNDPFNGFSHQHGIRRLDNGNVILFDNGNLHSPPTSRAVEYELDEQTRTARLVWEFRHEPTLFGFAMGFAQRQANGNTLICYGIAQRIIEVDPTGAKIWEAKIEEPNRFAYRAFRIDSLY